MNSLAQQARLVWPPLIAVAAVALIGVVALMPTRPLQDGATVVASKRLRFVEQRDGSMDVLDAATGRLAGVVPTVKDGFVPGMLHGMSIIRRHDGVAQNLPYRITEMSDGRVLLIDPPTRSEIDLESFGRGNAASFCSLPAWPGKGAALMFQRRIDATCLVDIEKSPHSFHAYAVPDNVEIMPGDEVLIHDAPIRIGYGEALRRECRITVRRAGPIARAWTRATSVFLLTGLYEVGFEAGEPK